MKPIEVNPNNEQYYSKEFIRGFNLGAERQFEADKADIPQGEWKLFYESKDGDNVYKCSCCRFITVIPEGIKLFSFCPNCGADMHKESE